MKFTADQVLAVLGKVRFPMSTSDIREDCNLNAGRHRFDGSNTDVRRALDELLDSGVVVCAKPLSFSARLADRKAAEANPYQFIASQAQDDRILMWMTRANADVFKQARTQRVADADAAQAKIDEIHRLLGGKDHASHAGAAASTYTRRVNFSLDGDGTALATIAAALSQYPHGDTLTGEVRFTLKGDGPALDTLLAALRQQTESRV